MEFQLSEGDASILKKSQHLDYTIFTLLLIMFWVKIRLILMNHATSKTDGKMFGYLFPQIDECLVNSFSFKWIKNSEEQQGCVNLNRCAYFSGRR